MNRLPKPFQRLLGAAATSNLADGLLLVGVPLLALGYTREPLLIAGLQAAFTLPWLLIALPVGALADRRSRRSLLVGANAVRGIGLLVAGVALASGHLGLAGLYLAVLLAGTAEVVADTTSQSVVPDLVDRDDLGRANGRLIGVQTVMNNFVGAPLAGVLVATVGAAVLLGPAALFLFAAVLLARLPGHYRPAARPPATLRADIGEGLRHLLGHPTLRALGILGGVLNLANAAYFGVFVLFVVGDGSPMGLPASAYGALAAMLAAGSVVGSLVAGRVEARLGPRRTLLGGAVSATLLMIVPLVTTAVAAVAGMAFLLGLASVLTNVASVSSRQRIVPRELLGRVNASFRVLVMGAMPLGAALGGAVASATSLATTFALAVGVQLMALAILQRPITDRVLRAEPEDRHATAGAAV